MSSIAASKLHLIIERRNVDVIRLGDGDRMRALRERGFPKKTLLALRRPHSGVLANLLRDKVVAKVLENTQEKLMELLQNELDRMSSEEEDDDLDLDSDIEEGDRTLEG
ncbi:hypothetical protein B0H65DRAFT_538349 [Neurospora tetraspora]|uniref:Uncharacterized protein n=1 Tax=Neurospora tetraspora TaxID=94610 RepID=A0AAE0MTX8_9PEZI|nr:hypothetical protein B0H65DRAFT_538349 [Neurospora tetraspora]